MRATTFTLLGLIGLSIHLTLTLAKHSSSSSKSNGDTVFNPERNKSINACDSPDGTLVNRKNNGKAVAWDPNGVVPVEQSDDPIFFLSPGESACGFNYTDADAGACLDPGWIDGGYINKCNAWIRVELPALGTKVDVRVLDSCSEGNPNRDSFGCNDVYLTLSSYSALAQGSQKIIDAGHLPGPANWHFLDREPCFACENGLPGINPYGVPDKCTGSDSDGAVRSGRKKGPERKFGAAAGEACSGLKGGGGNNGGGGGGGGYTPAPANYVEMFTHAAIKHGYKLKADKSGHPPTDQQQRSLQTGDDEQQASKRFNLLDKGESFAAKLLRNSAAEEGYE